MTFSFRKTPLSTTALAARLILSACGGSATETKPAQTARTESAAPAKDAPAAAEAKPVQTAPEPTKTAAPIKDQKPLLKRMSKHMSATSYRVDMTLSGNGEVFGAFSGSSKKEPTRKVSSSVSIAFSDFDKVGAIEAPAGAKQLKEVP
jgi:hypothetical protein